ncbi:hypothetical protein G6F59_014659 [Rhizopus arrhizus]|nr:hypothetical protein G6F59_014659 [Rhizopus arrhizus]
MDGYLYFYPLVTMDLTRRQFTHPSQGAQGAPSNAFLHIRTLPQPGAATPWANPAMLRSTGWLDLTAGPVVLAVPDTQGRRRAGQTHARHGQGHPRDRAAGLDGHAALGHGAHRRPHGARVGKGADPDRRAGRLRRRQRLAGRLHADAACAMEPARAIAAREVRPEPGPEDPGARTGGIHAHRRLFHLRGGIAAQASAARDRPACAGAVATGGPDRRQDLRIRPPGPSRQARHAPGPACRT